MPLRQQMMVALIVLSLGCSRKSPLGQNGPGGAAAVPPTQAVEQQTWQTAHGPSGPVFQGRTAAHWGRELRRDDPVVRTEAGRALSNLGEDGYPQLREALRSNSDEVRLTAIRSLPQTVMLAHQNETTPIFLNMVRDGNPEIRREAVVRLGWYGKEGRVFMPMLRTVMASDGDAKVRDAAMVTLDSIEQSITGVSKVNPK